MGSFGLECILLKPDSSWVFNGNAFDQMLPISCRIIY